MKLSKLMVCALMLIPHMSLATPRDFDQRFKALAFELIDAALANGWESIDGTPLRYLRQKMDQPTVQLNPRNATLTIDNRETATWDRDRGVIFVNQKPWEDLPEEFKPGISMHELLGAGGHGDHDYRISLRLELMAKTKFEPKSTLHQVQSLRSGGSTGVGGGGDGADFIFKSRTVSTLLSWWQRRAHSQAQLELVQVMRDHLLDLGFRMERSAMIEEDLKIKADTRQGQLILSVGLNRYESVAKSGQLHAYICAAVLGAEEERLNSQRWGTKEILKRLQAMKALCL